MGLFGESLTSVLREFFASINKAFVLAGGVGGGVGGGWALGYHSMGFRHFQLFCNS